MKFKILLAALLAAFAGSVNAQTPATTYPAKAVRVVVGFGTGGGTDTLARVLSRKLADIWPHSLVVETVPARMAALPRRSSPSRRLTVTRW